MIGFIENKYMCHFDDIYDLAISLNEYADMNSCNEIFITDGMDTILAYIINGAVRLARVIDPDKSYNIYGKYNSYINEDNIPIAGDSLYKYGEQIRHNWPMITKLLVYPDSTKLIPIEL